MSQSLYIELKKRHPEAIIDVLAPAWCAPILARMPQIHTSFEMPVGHGEFNLTGRWKIGRKLARNNYTHAYILPNSAKSSLIPFFAGIKHRTGWKGEMRYGLLNDLRPDKRIFQYMVERYVALASTKQSMLDEVNLATCAQPRLNIDLANQKKLRQQLNLTSERPIISLCPGAEFGPSKRWPDQYYAQLANHLIAEGNQVWLFGSQKDQTVTQAIYHNLTKENQTFCFDLAGKTALIDVIDLIACSQTVFCNDSGLMHVAAAAGCKIVAIYGSTSPRYTPPLTDKAVIVQKELECRPCFKRECPLGHMDCLNQLYVDDVIAEYHHNILSD